MNIALTFMAILLVSLVSLVGIFTLGIKTGILKRFTMILISLAIGVFLGDVFLHILPHSIEEGMDISMGMLLGVIILIVLEKLLHWHHCHGEKDHDHKNIHPMAFSNIIGDGLHNFLDGVLIAISFSISIEIGVASTIAVILHEIPQELADYAILIEAGFSKTKALVLNLLSALVAVLGGLFAILAVEKFEIIEPWLLGITAGVFLYIALSDLIPIVKQENTTKKSLIQGVSILFGLVLMVGLSFVEIDTHDSDVYENEEVQHVE